MKTLIPAARAIFCVMGLWLANVAPGSALAQSTNECGSLLDSGFFSKFIVFEHAEYLQTNAAGAFLDGSNAFHFDATIDLSTNLTASAATVTVPGQTPLPMTGNSKAFSLSVATNTLANLSSAFPGGDYSFIISNNATTVNLPSVSQPNAPILANYDAAQLIDATKDFSLGWEPFSGGGTKDFIAIVLTDQSGATVFRSAKFGCPDALDGTVTSFPIPANTLATNQTYRTVIRFIKVLTFETNSPPGKALMAGTYSATKATVATGPGTAPPPPSGLVLTNAAWLAGGSVRFDLTTTPGVTYTIEFNQDLSNPSGWTPLLTTGAATNYLLAFTNSPPSGAKAGFYRALQN
jgi:hypothetical protein